LFKKKGLEDAYMEVINQERKALNLDI